VTADLKNKTKKHPANLGGGFSQHFHSGGNCGKG